MEGVAHNPMFAKKVGVPRHVGLEFVNADKRMHYGSGFTSDYHSAIHHAKKRLTEKNKDHIGASKAHMKHEGGSIPGTRVY